MRQAYFGDFRILTKMSRELINLCTVASSSSNIIYALEVGHRLQHADTTSTSQNDYLLFQWLLQDSIHNLLVHLATIIFSAY